MERIIIQAVLFSAVILGYFACSKPASTVPTPPVIIPVAKGLLTSYYVDNALGNDANTGRSSSQAWKSLAKVQSMAFQPGDTVNFARGSVWAGSVYEFLFKIDDNGTAAKPIVFRAYGTTGNKPTFTNIGKFNCGITIVADYVILENLMIANTGNKGFSIENGADNNIIQNCEVTKTGIAFNITGSYNLLTNNYIHDLWMVVDDTGGNCSLPRTDPLWNRNPCDNDYGCVSFWLYGPFNEISYNRSINNIGHSYDYTVDGGFLEFYTNVEGTYAHHNYIENGVGIAEGCCGPAKNVTIAYNVFNENSGLFAFHTNTLILENFKFENNTCITRKGTQYNNMFGWNTTDIKVGTVLMRNNIFVFGGTASERVAKSNSFLHQHNLYYLLDGAQLGSVVLDVGERLGNPLFTNEATKDFSILPGSPAKNAGINLGYSRDFNGTALPAGISPSMGAFQ